jgi:hypothetical protein
MSLAWFHTQIWCYGNWLPGDPRGFRSDNHRIHSSGDYKHRPPTGEHAALHHHAQQSLTQPPVQLSPFHFPIALEAMRRWFMLQSLPLLAVSVGAQHSHLLCRLPAARTDCWIGRLKKYASQRLSIFDRTLPSRIYAAKGEPKRIKDLDHLRECYPYIVVKHAREGALTWGVGEDGIRGISSLEDPGPVAAPQGRA